MREWIAPVVSAVWLAALAGSAAAAGGTAADYARRPDVHAVVVSPSNTHAALRLAGPGGRVVLAVIDLANPSDRKVVAAYDNLDIDRVSWVNDKRLVYSASEPGPTIAYDMWGTFAVDRDGDEARQITTGRSDTEAPTGSMIRQRALDRRWSYLRPVGDGSDDVLVTRTLDSLEFGKRPQTLSRLDTRTMKLTPLSDGQPEGAAQWLTDGQGRLRVVTTEVKDQSALWWLPQPGAAWEKLREWSTYGGSAIHPRALEADGTLVVSSRYRSDTTALYTYDTAKKKIDAEPLVGVQGFDVEGLIFDRRQQRVAGVLVDAQQPTTVWFDEGLAKAQAAVDKALPGRSNRLLCGNCIGATRFVVASASDRQPTEYLLFDLQAGRLTPMIASRPWLAGIEQGRRSYHRIAARDGLSLPVVVTHPPGVPADRPAPTVVLVHGGPWADGADLMWSHEPAFLATRGYRVLEVSFRGTTGLGWKHERASWGQWGLAMQDDLEDALLWAAKEKLTDAGRVCIVGASYGGYAALMGPVRHPGRYRCAVSHVGVTDLALMYSANWTDVTPAGRTYGYPAMIGDRVKDAELLRRQSPIHRVAEIKVPLLVAQGRLDRRVTPEHADRFVAAARAAGVEVERVDYEEGHGFSRAESEADFLGRLEAFLARHLKAH
jgi:dipeptidyl aminopeptidase/acylaminoacyl peptidase